MVQAKLKRIKKEERLRVGLLVRSPDLNKGASYRSPNRKMKIYVNGNYSGTLKSSDAVRLDLRVRDVIVAKKIFESEKGIQIDFTQKYIVGQNFIDCTFNTGTKRRLNASFKEGNTLTLLQQQDFWK